MERDTTKFGIFFRLGRSSRKIFVSCYWEPTPECRFPGLLHAMERPLDLNRLHLKVVLLVRWSLVKLARCSWNSPQTWPRPLKTVQTGDVVFGLGHKMEAILQTYPHKFILIEGQGCRSTRQSIHAWFCDHYATLKSRFYRFSFIFLKQLLKVGGTWQHDASGCESYPPIKESCGVGSKH